MKWDSPVFNKKVPRRKKIAFHKKCNFYNNVMFWMNPKHLKTMKAKPQSVVDSGILKIYIISSQDHFNL